MSGNSVWKRVLGLSRVVLEQVGLQSVARPGGAAEQVVVASVRPHQRYQDRCPRCGRRSPRYDWGEGRRRWRGLDLGSTRAFLEADAPRVRCVQHGVVVAAVPWADHDTRVTRAFADQTAWLAAHASRSTVAALMRIEWKTVTAIVTRTVDRLAGASDRLTGLRRVCIDEVSYRKGHRYLLRVTNADTGRQIWAGQHATKQTLQCFFDALGPDRARNLTAVAADGAEWIHDVVAANAPAAVICLDPYHVVAWANEALSQLRRDLARGLRSSGRSADAQTLKGSRWALVKNPEDLTTAQRTTIAAIAHDNKKLYTGYLIKEQLREVFKTEPHQGKRLLTGVISWCSRTRSPPLIDLGRRLRRFQPLIRNTLHHNLSNAQAEAGNNNLRLLTRRAYGFASPDTLIAMSELTLGGLCPPLPGRT